MKNRFKLRIGLSLSTLLNTSLLALLLIACSPSATSTATQPAAVPTQPPARALPSATFPPPSLEPATEAALSEAATAVPLATSRGANLEATDPTTVSLASGGLQFVEFFRFT